MDSWFCKFVVIAGAILAVAGGDTGLVVAHDLQPEATEMSIDGDATVAISLPFSTNGLGVSHYQFNVVGDGYTWTLTNVGSGQASARTGATIPLGGQNLALTVTTAGLPVTGPTATTTQYIDFIPCTQSPNVQCFATLAKRYRFIVDPTLTATPNSTITVNGSSTRQIELVWSTALNGQSIAASCEKDAGTPAITTIAVSPATRVTDANARADFAITTSGLRLIADSGNPPSGRCTFRAHASSARTAVVPVQGQRIAPSLNVSPSSVNVPNSGSTEVDRVVVVGTRSPAEGGVTIDASCTAESPATVSLDGSAAGSAQNGSKVANASGEVQFRVLSQNLVTVPPTGSPHVRCRFKVRELAETYEYYVSGRQIAPSVALSMQQITQTGTTTLTATLSPAYPGFDILPSCTTQGLAPVSAVETSSTTNASGQQAFNVMAPELVVTNPNGVQPSASCTFRVVGANGGVGGAGFLSFRSGNTCVMTLSPLPPACGNPN
ncbi:hypothetical protein [Tahibacter sp.]|uniref:hypothetical protein n=1 Tax=Tahibacter sp. TaxID=2056211 RepID=UPI0028C3CED7|nr:hypothetical protein [Tahibacter sp.]